MFWVLKCRDCDQCLLVLLDSAWCCRVLGCNKVRGFTWKLTHTTADKCGYIETIFLQFRMDCFSIMSFRFTVCIVWLKAPKHSRRRVSCLARVYGSARPKPLSIRAKKGTIWPLHHWQTSSDFFIANIAPLQELIRLFNANIERLPTETLNPTP